MSSTTRNAPDDLVCSRDVLRYLRELAGVTIYRLDEPPRPAIADPEKAFVREVQQGWLTVFINGKAQSREFLSNKDRNYILKARFQLSRAEVLAIWPDHFEKVDKQARTLLPGFHHFVEPKIMPADEAGQYKLLWDHADEMSRDRGHTPEWHWLRLIGAFLQGDPTQSGLVYFYRSHDAARRGYLRYRPDDFRAAIERMAKLGDLTIENLRNWSWGDYQKLPEFQKPPEPHLSKEYFIERDPDGLDGLMAQREEIDRWRRRASLTGGASIVNENPVLAEPRTESGPWHETRDKPQLHGKRLIIALDVWVLKKWGDDPNKLPGSGELLRLARIEFPESHITQDHARDLRKKHATEKAKRGGAPTHRSRSGS